MPPLTVHRETGVPAIDAAVVAFLEKNGVPGAAVALMEGAKLACAGAYGFADIPVRRPYTEHTPQRLGSLSKPVTAAAVLRLIAGGKLSLDAPFLRCVPGLTPLAVGDGGRRRADARADRITLRHLLRHASGLDTASLIHADSPVFAATGKKRITTADVARYALGSVPLRSDPGTAYAYSNLNYVLAGVAVEKASGMPYEAYCRRHVLAPLGVTGMKIGSGFAPKPADPEARYYGPSDGSMTPYGPDAETFMRLGEASGGWVGSLVDVCLLLRGLAPAALAEQVAEPDEARLVTKTGNRRSYYGLGWVVNRYDGVAAPEITHAGMQWCATSTVTRRADGIGIVVLMNGGEVTKGYTNAAALLTDEITALLDRGEKRGLPSADLFPSLLRARPAGR